MITANLMVPGLSIFTGENPAGRGVLSRAGGCLAARLKGSSWSVLLPAPAASPCRCETSSFQPRPRTSPSSAVAAELLAAGAAGDRRLQGSWDWGRGLWGIPHLREQ